MKSIYMKYLKVLPFLQSSVFSAFGCCNCVTVTNNFHVTVNIVSAKTFPM